MTKSIWLFGHHAVKAALEAQRRPIYSLKLTRQHQDTYKPLAQKAGIKTQLVEKHTLDKMTQQPHQGIALEAGPLPQKKLQDAFNAQRLLILDQVTDPHNVGACLRSANAFGCGAVIMQHTHSPKDSPIIAKAAVGALEVTPLVTVPNLATALEALKKEGFWAIGLDGYAQQNLSEIPPQDKTVIVMGSEGKGLRPLIAKKCDYLAKLPMVGSVESLNVSVATGIALYEVSKDQ